MKPSALNPLRDALRECAGDTLAFCDETHRLLELKRNTTHGAPDTSENAPDIGEKRHQHD